MRDYLFSTNNENAFDLQKKFNLNDFDTDYLHQNFWPIIVLTNISRHYPKFCVNDKDGFVSF